MERDLLRPTDFREGDGYAATLALLALPEPPAAILAVSGLLGVGALEALARLFGSRVGAGR